MKRIMQENPKTRPESTSVHKHRRGLCNESFAMVSHHPFASYMGQRWCDRGQERGVWPSGKSLRVQLREDGEMVGLRKWGDKNAYLNEFTENSA